jgi:hypothetical protein
MKKSIADLYIVNLKLMYKLIKSLFGFLFIMSITACNSYLKTVTEEVVLKNGETATGKLMYCDSSSLKLQKMDLSLSVYNWSEVDSVRGIKFKTHILSFNSGYFSTPYYSVFRGENFKPNNLGFQMRVGTAKFHRTFNYVHYTFIPSNPYNISKLGMGTQRYILSDMASKKSFLAGLEGNLLFINYNNVPQVALEPFIGYEFKLNDQLRLHVKMGTQRSILSKNPDWGIHFTAGINFLSKNYKKHYHSINHLKCIPTRTR